MRKKQNQKKKKTITLLIMYHSDSGKMQNVVPYSRAGGMQTLPEGFELLGIKWLPSLSAQHAKQLTPYEVGDKQWKPSIQMLTSGSYPP